MCVEHCQTTRCSRLCVSVSLSVPSLSLPLCDVTLGGDGAGETTGGGHLGADPGAFTGHDEKFLETGHTYGISLNTSKCHGSKSQEATNT